MKIKFLFLTLIVLIFTIDTLAQITDFSWSEVIEKSENQTFKKALVDDNKNIYILKTAESNKGMVYMDILDSLGNILQQQTIDLSCDRIENSDIINDKVCIFATSYNLKEKKDILSVYQISTNGTLSSTLPLMKMDANGGYHCLFDPKISPNKKFISIVCTHPFKDNHSEELTTNLYDSDFTELKSTHLSTSIPCNKRRTTVSVVNDEGFTYVIKKHRVKTKTLFDIFTFDSHGHHHHNHLHAKSKKIADMDYKLDKNGSMILAGFYSSPNRKNFEGVFAMEFKESVYPSWTKSYILNEGIITTFKSKKEIGASGYGLDRFHVKNLLFNDNGDIILTAEHHGIAQDKKLGTMDYRKGLVVAQLNKTGGMKGVVAIPLNQRDAKNAGYFSSHSLLVDTTNTIVLCNKIGPADAKIKADKSTGAAVHIEQNMISKSMTNTASFPVFNPNFNNYLLQPAIQISNSKTQIILLESMDSMKYKIGFIYSIEE